MTPEAERAAICMLAMQRHPWEQGVCAQALLEADRDDCWIPMAYDAIRRQSSDGRLAMIGGGAAVSDPAANGEVCLRAYQKTGNPFYLDGAKRMLFYLQKKAPRTEDGVICHNSVTFEAGFSPRQLWIDGLYMVPPFLAVMGETEEAWKQIRGYIRHLFDPSSNLFLHIVDTETGRYVRQKHWATGNGWALMGLARVIEEMDRQGCKDGKKDLSAFLETLLQGMLAWQLPDGRFRDILDDPESFADGTSAMMMAATVYRGSLNGYVNAGLIECAEKAYHAVRQGMDETGLIHGVCGSPHFDSEGTSAEAQAAFVMADAWRSRVGKVNRRTVRHENRDPDDEEEGIRR